MEVSTNLGRVSLVPQGEYDSSRQYRRLDVVQYQGNGYIVLRTVQGVEPSDGEDFMLLAERGSAGQAGDGVPAGGSAGQVLAKKSDADGDVEWTAQQGGADVDLSAYALKTNPVFTGNMLLGTIKEGSSLGGRAVSFGSDNDVSSGFSFGRRNTVSYWGSAMGDENVSSGELSFTAGFGNKASSYETVSLGFITAAPGVYAQSQNNMTIASGRSQTAMGSYNIESTEGTDKLIVGKGVPPTETGGKPATRANCLRVTHTGVYASGNYNASGADYAEMFEWADGNPESQDRAGLFVTLDGDKIRIAGPEDDYIAGIVSGDPSVVGDVQDDQWRGMYLYDVFGRPLWEDVEVQEVKADGVVMVPAGIIHTQKINPDYDSSQAYVPRSRRPEWDAVGLLGKLVAVDDGSCEVNGWCTVGEGGTAVRSETRTRYRVMARLDERHIRVLIL